MSGKIKIYCDCGKSFDVNRDKESPKNAISMGCNWCPVCEDTAEDYYYEWYNESDSGEQPEPTPDNQLMLFTDFDEIINEQKVIVESDN